MGFARAEPLLTSHRTVTERTEAVRQVDGEHKSLLQAFRIEQSWARVINKINSIIGAGKGLVRFVEHGPNAAKLRSLFPPCAPGQESI